MSCIERSIAIYHKTGAAIAGTSIVVPDPDGLGNIWKTISVINDSNQDIKVKYRTSTGYLGEFIVPMSIKGFTKSLKNGVHIDNTSLSVVSMHASSAATGNITINLGV